MKNDARNYLYIQYIKFLEKYRPKMFIFENVLGIFSAQNGKILEDINYRIDRLGYTMDVSIVDASDIGVLQKRKRVIIRGIRKDLNLNMIELNFQSKRKNFVLKDLWEDLPSLNAGKSKNGKVYIKKPKKKKKIL